MIALDIIKTAMRHIGVLAVGETPSADQTNDGLASLGDVIGTWNNSSLLVWQSSVEAFVTVAGQAAYTIGATGNWVTTRPVSIGPSFATYSGIDYPLQSLTYDEYNMIGLKTIQSSILSGISYVNDFPNGKVYLYPTPSTAVTISLDTATAITAPLLSSTTLSFPPGYSRALQWDLAIEIAPQYGMELTDKQLRIAASAKAAIKRANHVPVVASFDAALGGGNGPYVFERGF